jgi:hypothetical protein
MTDTGPSDSSYERAMQPMRDRLRHQSPFDQVLAPGVDPDLLLAFLAWYCALGVQATRPVGAWMSATADRCDALGMTDLAEAQRRDARDEDEHYSMFITDAHALAEIWNRKAQRPPMDASALLAHPETPGLRAYRLLHEEVGRDRPHRQLAIQYEIERLSIDLGPEFLSRVQAVLGPSMVRTLSFLRVHVTLDAHHVPERAAQVHRFLAERSETTAEMIDTGKRALDAYITFMADALALARRFVAGPGAGTWPLEARTA